MTATHEQSRALASASANVDAALGAWRAMALDLPVTIATETLRFAARRLTANADHLGALTRCKSLSDAAELQSAFLTRTVADYQSEAGTVIRDVQEAVAAKAA